MRVTQSRVFWLLFFSFLALDCFSEDSISFNAGIPPSPYSFVKIDSLGANAHLTLDSAKTGTWHDLFTNYDITNHFSFLPFSLKYRGITSCEIAFVPSPISLVKLHAPNRYLLDSLTAVFKNAAWNMQKVEERYIINHPDKVHLLWCDIPEPSKILERGFMHRKSAVEEMRKMIPHLKDEDQKKIWVRKDISQPWKFKGIEYLQLQQVGHSNWKKGGDNNVAFLNDLRLTLIYKVDKVEWESFVISKLAVTINNDQGMQLNDDVLELNTKYGYKASQNWFYSAFTNFKTQLFYNSVPDGSGKEHYISGFLAPGYFTAALGMDYKKGELFSILISPLTAKITFLTDTININPADYQIPKGQMAKKQVGFSINSAFKIPFTNLISFKGRVELFKDYLDKQNSWFFDMENILDLRINRYLTTRINIVWRYTGMESTKLQFKENIQVGFTYNF